MRAPSDTSLDACLDALRFAWRPRPGRAARLRSVLRQVARHPRRAAALAWAWLSGKRLRARQGWFALVGVDHRLLPAGSALPDHEPASALARHGIDLVAGAAGLGGGDAAILVLTAPGHALVAGAAEAIASAFAGAPALHALYGDAVVSLDSGARLPLLRPAFDPDYLRAVDYVGPVAAVRRTSLEAVGTDLCTGAATFDLLLRVGDAFGPAAIGHLPEILSLWRPAGGGEGAPSRVGRMEAVRRSLDRAGRPGVGLALREDGVIEIAHPLPAPRPLTTLIVPTRDRLDLLRPCIESLLACTDWAAREILICDNDSREPATLAYFRDLEREGVARIVPCPGPFNFAAMNNRAADRARGELLAFINNDVEAFRPDWLERMVREALRPEVGAVGAKLLDGEGRIQHGGIVLGTGGLVTHGHRHFVGDAPGYLGALSATHRVSAVTAACLVVERAKFRRVGGFDAEHFAVDFNDVDLCLRLNEAGYRAMLVPGAVLHHREAASRRWTPAARARHAGEVAALRKRWGPLLAQDPHYHPGFDADLPTHARLRAGRTATGRGGVRPPAPSRSRT